MKTDKFDDAIKQKLEGIEPTFQEEDWDKFMAFAHAQKVPFWKTLASKSVLYTAAAAVVVVSSVILTLTQYYAKKDLQQELLSVKQQRDSVVAAKQMLAEQLSKQQQKNATQLPLATATAPDAPATLLDESTASTSIEGKYVVGKKTLGGKAGGLWAGLTEKRNQAFRKAWTKKASNGNGGGIDKGTIEVTEVAHKPLLTSAIVLKTLPAKQALWDSSYRTMATITKTNFGYYQFDTTQEKHWRFSLADASLRAGVQAYTGPKQQAIGGQVEFFLDKRLSISAGLRFVSLTKETYLNDYHFKDFNDFDFRVRFAPKVPFGAPIKNIEIQNTLLQIPIQLSYYMPLARSFFVFGKVGTDLDLSGTKQVCFDIKDKTELTQTQVNSSLETITLNNYNVSVGFEKRFGPVALQVSPSYGFTYKAVDYKINGLGLDLKINYTF